MSSFRILNTTFRILKGGKIGLAASIALVGGILTLGSTSASATNYFTYTPGTTFSDGGAVATAYSNTGATSLNRNSVSLSDDVVFQPIGVSSSYTGVDGWNDNGWAGSIGTNSYWWDADNNDSCFGGDRCDELSYSSGTTLSSGTYTITFLAGDNSNDIYKNSGNNITVKTGYTGGIDGDPRYYGYTTTVAFDYTANLVFNGVNTVSGYTDIGVDEGSILINGSVDFAQYVRAGDIELDTTADVYFNGDVDLDTSSMSTRDDSTNSIHFSKAANVTFNASVDGNIDFNGHDGTITLNDSTVGNDIDTSLSGTGTLILGGAATVYGDVGSTSAIKEIQLDSNQFNKFEGSTNANLVDINAAGTIGFVGGLDTTLSDGTTLGTIDFNNYDATVQIGDYSALIGNVVTDSNNNGTVTMISGIQTITGQIGASGLAIKTLNIGGENIGGIDTSGAVFSRTTINGDVFAETTYLNNNSSVNSILYMSADSDLNSVVSTTDSDKGVLSMLGGTQSVTGQVGTDTSRLSNVYSGANGAITNFGGSVYAVGVNNTETGTSNFSIDVVATTIDVNNGTSNFTNDVTATTTKIESGTGNFNTNGSGTTNSILEFDGNGTANLYTGLTGAITFDGNNAIVNVWDAQTITGAVTTATTSNTGTVNFKGDGTINGTGASNMGISALNININDEQDTSVIANGDIYTASINLLNDGVLEVNSGFDLTDTDTTTAGFISTVVENTGTLTLSGGTQSVNGQVGTSTVSLKEINAGQASGNTTFNGMVYATTMNIGANGTATLNGENTTATEGMVGTVNFGNQSNTLEIGDNVDLTVGTSGIQFADANQSDLKFNANSSVTGNVGSLDGADTLKSIEAGEDSTTVSFAGDVYFMDSLNFYGNGTVKITADATVKRNNTSSSTGAIVTTTNNGEGTLNFAGGIVLHDEIGTSTNQLKAVNFNTNDDKVTQTIDKNIYATTTTIGGTFGTTELDKINVTGTYDYAGATDMQEFAGGTVANIGGNIAFGNDLVIANDTSAINFGISQITVGNDFTTNNGGLSFTVNSLDITGADDAASSSDGSAKVTVTGDLNMTGDEQVHINYVGSLASNGTYVLVDSATATGTYSAIETGNVTDNVTDNSSIIDTVVRQATAQDVTDLIADTQGDLIVIADRTMGGTITTDELYVAKSDTEGHFSNNASKILSTIASDGSQAGDMIEVIQKLELDSFGYGNTAEKLATQVKKLAPIVNTSSIQTYTGATNLVTNTISNRIANVSGLSSGEKVLDKGFWIKATGSKATQDQDGQYDGYTVNSYGSAFGFDKESSNGLIIGLAGGYTYSDTEQDDFRDGTESTTKSYQISAYASKTFDNFYVDGSLSYTRHDTNGSRETAIDRTASYDTNSNQYSININGGYNFITNYAVITPHATLGYSHINQDAYEETGADALNLEVDELKINRGNAGIGVKVATTFENNSVKFTPSLNLGAKKYFGDDSVEVTARFAGGGDKFVTTGAELNDVIYNAGLGLESEISENTTISVNADYERNSDNTFDGINGQVTLKIKF